MRMRNILIAAGVLLGMAVVLPATAQEKSGRYKVVLMNNSVVEGDLTEVDGGYQIKNRYGILIKLKKSEVRRMEKLADAPAAAESENAPSVALAAISEEDILRVLGDDALEESDVESTMVDLSPLPVDESSVSEMLKIAGAGASAQRLETDHFVLVYSSSKETARTLGARLESVYTWCHKFMDMLGIQAVRPDYKLEIYFYNTHQEFKAYGNNQGGVPDWAAGFYIRTNNRSAFFDLNDEPTVAGYKKQLENAHWRQKQYWNNRIKRYSDFLNLSVIQHEAAHHIHFNVGIFPKKGDMPRFLTEGLAQMFELPPGKLGGGLGATNHYRLAQFHQQFNRKQGGNPNAIIPLRTFITDDQNGWPAAYPQAWALTNFLWKKHRDGFASYMQKMANREDGVEITETQRQQEFEDLFGPCSELDEKFKDYSLGLQFRRSAIDF
jgi:hypothetical protein